MKLNDVLPIFKTKAAIADLLQIRPQNVAKWKKRGNLVPEAHRATLMLAAHGKLKVSASQVEQWEQEKAKLNRAIRLAQR